MTYRMTRSLSGGECMAMKKKTPNLTAKPKKKKPARPELRSVGSQPILLFVLFQLVSLLIMMVSGRTTAYLSMLVPLVIITYGGWLIVSRIGAEITFFINAAMLLTFGTMIQCMLLKEDVVPKSLILIYALSAGAGLIAGFLYRRMPGIASANGTAALMVLSVILYLATLILGAAVGGGVRNWIRIGGMSIQPSEFNKCIYVLVMAGLLCTKP
ncbi:MAG TPA: hypothetical protein DDX51_03620, partial [Clostridiales bacterium]|nr:hypothetical protein [Clostridiales bacterium]